MPRSQPIARGRGRCEAPDLELLFVEWLNAIIYEMAVRDMLFGGLPCRSTAGGSTGTLWGEPVDVERARAGLRAEGRNLHGAEGVEDADGTWSAGCIVDV